MFQRARVSTKRDNRFSVSRSEAKPRRLPNRSAFNHYVSRGRNSRRRLLRKQKCWKTRRVWGHMTHIPSRRAWWYTSVPSPPPPLPFFSSILPIPGSSNRNFITAGLAYPAEAALPGMLGVCYPGAIVHPWWDESDTATIWRTSGWSSSPMAPFAPGDPLCPPPALYSRSLEVMYGQISCGGWSNWMTASWQDYAHIR